MLPFFTIKHRLISNFDRFADEICTNQFAQGLRTPLIFDDSLELSDPEESRFAGAYSDGLLAKSEAILSMSAFQKAPQSDLLSE